MALHPVILAGGSGTRLWPLSREYYPKQFLPLMGERSLIQETVCRLEGIPEVAAPVVVCNEEHRFLVAEHLRQVGLPPSSIVLEPEGRNTAPALSLAAMALLEEYQYSDNPDPIMLVMPADHVIRDVTAFQTAVEQGVAFAEQGNLVTFGIVPNAPKTGFGYIKKGERVQQPAMAGAAGMGLASNGGMMTEPAFVDTFVEKPDESTAEKMLATGEYLWNAGIFMMRATVWMDQLQKFRPDIAASCMESFKDGKGDGDFFRPELDSFRACPSDSIDYAVMENVGTSATASNGNDEFEARCVVVPLDAGWSDLGAWSSMWEEADKDDSGNMIEGDVHAYSMKDSLLIGQHRLVAAVGLENVIVVETADAVLVANKDQVEDVKGLVSQLKSAHRVEQEQHRLVHRPWGTYEVIDGGDRFQVKRLTVNPGGSLSLQMHHHRAEHWVVVSGTAKVTKGEETFLLTEDQSSYVPVGVKHRLENPGAIPLEIIEVQSGSYTGEDDIVRFEDRYNRAG